LNHNGQWDAAAKEVGIHRHSLRARIQKLERMLGLSFERFGDRAQMWALLTSVDLGGTGAPQTLLSSSSGSSTQRAT
jgi:purine catabolism regulator